MFHEDILFFFRFFTINNEVIVRGEMVTQLVVMLILNMLLILSLFYFIFF